MNRLLATVLLLAARSAQAQHEHHPPATPPPAEAAPAHEGHEAHDEAHAGHEQHGEAQGEHDHGEHAGHEGPDAHQGHAPPTLTRLETARIASGTAWQPTETPHAAFHVQAAGWTLMAHALLFAGWDWQGSDRGAHAPTGIGWLMGMAERPLATGTFVARVMLSPELLTIRDGGYPLLLQTGETFEGQALHDRQHPHDLLMEAALLHTQEVTPAVAVQVYAALSGEPALGPPGFPHRASAAADPLAVLGHHWQDSTHISFGVLTAGVLTRFGKLEGSWFNGREPDEDRYDVELRRPDSYAVRLSVEPTPDLVAQASYGYLPSHEVLDPDVELHRVTVSASHGRAVGAAGQWASTAAFGLNKEGHGPAATAFLLESTLDLDGANMIFGRLEVVEKTGHDLVLTPALEEEKFRVGTLALGYVRNFGPFAGFVPGVGVRGAIGLVPSGLEPFYGQRTPVGGMVYGRLGVAPMAHVH
jgi:hypothetical protein